MSWKIPVCPLEGEPPGHFSGKCQTTKTRNMFGRTKLWTSLSKAKLHEQRHWRSFRSWTLKKLPQFGPKQNCQSKIIAETLVQASNDEKRGIVQTKLGKVSRWSELCWRKKRPFKVCKKASVVISVIKLYLMDAEWTRANHWVTSLSINKEAHSLFSYGLSHKIAIASHHTRLVVVVGAQTAVQIEHSNPSPSARGRIPEDTFTTDAKWQKNKNFQSFRAPNKAI